MLDKFMCVHEITQFYSPVMSIVA